MIAFVLFKCRTYLWCSLVSWNVSSYFYPVREEARKRITALKRFLINIWRWPPSKLLDVSSSVQKIPSHVLQCRLVVVINKATYIRDQVKPNIKQTSVYVFFQIFIYIYIILECIMVIKFRGKETIVPDFASVISFKLLLHLDIII